MKKTGLMKGIALFAVMALAGAATAGEESPGRWTFSAGPAWRSRVKSSISGRPSDGPSVPASQTTTYDKDIAGHGPWSLSEVEVVGDPYISGSLLYAATRTGTERTVTPGSGATALNDSDIDRPLGISISAGRDFYSSGRFAAGLSLRFAGYWDMKSHACGQSGGGTVTSRSWKDYHLFENGPFPDEDDFTNFKPDSDPYLPYREELGGSSGQTIPGRRICARLSSDLYQVGIGPKLTWRAFDRVDVFGGVEALCNFSHLEAECGEARRTETDCLPGVGARLGLVAYLTDNIGLQVDAGYEWIDEADVSLGGVRAEVDYSSFVATAGIALRF